MSETILSKIASYHSSNVNNLRPLGAEAGQYHIPSYVMETALNLFKGINIELPVGSKEIVARYLILNPTHLIGMGRTTQYAYHGTIGSTPKEALDFLEDLHKSKSKSFLTDYVMKAFQDGFFSLAVDVEQWDEAGNVDSMLVNLNTKGFEGSHTLMDISRNRDIQNVQFDFKRRVHASPIVVLDKQLETCLSTRYSCKDKDTGQFVYLKNVVDRIQYDNQVDASEYRDGTKSVREFDIKIPTHGLAYKEKTLDILDGKVYLNRASKFGVLSVQVPNPKLSCILPQTITLDTCVTVLELDGTKQELRILDGNTRGIDAVYDGHRIITMTFQIDGW